MDGFAQATQNIVQGFSGALSDRLRKRKSIALIGYFLAAIAKPMMGFATVWQGVFGARVLDRFGTGTRSAPRDALIAPSVDEKNRGTAFGWKALATMSARSSARCSRPFCFTLHRLACTHFYVALIPGPLAFFMVLLVKERSAPVAAKAKIDISLRAFPKAYRRYLLATARFGLGNSSNAFLILRPRGRGVTLETTILIYAGFNLAAALISYPAGSLSDTWGRRNMLLAAFVIFLINYLGFALVRDVLLVGTLSSMGCIRAFSGLSTKRSIGFYA